MTNTVCVSLKIHATFERCAGGATCNCAVFIRAHLSVLVVDKCRTISRPGDDSSCHVTTSARIIVAKGNRPSSGSSRGWELGLRVFSRADHEFEVLAVTALARVSTTPSVWYIDGCSVAFGTGRVY